MAEPCRRKIQELIGLMQKNLECSICLEMLNNPVSTSCGHQFCRFCLMEFLERKKQVPCPLCKKVITKRSLMNRSELGQMVGNVRNLISAFQCDTGLLFSPPRGPQTIDLLPCTPDTILAKTATDMKRRSVGGIEKKAVKGKNVRMGRRRTVDNSDLDLVEAAEQTVVEGATNRDDSATRVCHRSFPGSVTSNGEESIKNHNETISKPEELSNSNLLEYIENGDHCSSNVDIKTKEDETVINHKNQPKKRVVSKTKCPSTVTEMCFDELSGNKNDVTENTYSEDNMVTSSIVGVPDNVTDQADSNNNPSNSTCVSNQSENVCPYSGEGHAPVIEAGPLFQTPLVPAPVNKRGRKQADLNGAIWCDRRELRSRYKQTEKSVDDDIDVSDGKETLTPDTVGVHTPHLEFTQGNFNDIKTYSRKNLNKQDQEANKKVTEWLKSVTHNKDKKVKVTESNSMEKANEKKRQTHKKVTKLQAEEEKMGLKLKHLAEQVSTVITDSCFGFDDKNFEGSDRVDLETEDKNCYQVYLNNKLNDSYSENHVEEGFKDSETNSMLRETQTIRNSAILQEDDSKKLEHNEGENGKISCRPNDAEGHVTLQKGQKSEVISVNNVLLNKRRIFKTKLSNKGDISIPSQDTADITPESVSTEMKPKIQMKQDCKKASLPLYHGVENEMIRDQGLQHSDPYEFKSSQNTPRKIRKKTGKHAQLAKKQTKKQGSKSVQLKSKTVANKSSIHITRGKGKDNKIQRTAGQQQDALEDMPISCTQEEIRKMSSKLNQAEEYDLLTCTQEAVDSIEKEENIRENFLLNGHFDKNDPERLEIRDTETDPEVVKSKLSQQKRVRFREPVISDFIHSGKIDILGYRQAKENMKKIGSDKENCVAEQVKVNEEGIDSAAVKNGVRQNAKSKDNETKGKIYNSDDTSANNLTSDAENEEIHENLNFKNMKRKFKNDNSRKKKLLDPANIDEDKHLTGTTEKGIYTSASDEVCSDIAIKNPMMTPTLLKKAVIVPGTEGTETFDEELNSSGTDDLNIHPEQDQFEEPDIDIQPDEIKSKLSSQELFVQNVLSTPKESLKGNFSPHVIEETPAVFAVPQFSAIQKQENIRRANQIEPEHHTAVSVFETPVVNQLSSSVKESPALYNENPLIKVDQVNKLVQENSLGFLKGNKEADSNLHTETNETVSPNEMAVSNIDKDQSENVHSASSCKIAVVSTPIIEEYEENSVSLLKQESQMPLHINGIKKTEMQVDTKNSERSQPVLNNKGSNLLTLHTKEKTYESAKITQNDSKCSKFGSSQERIEEEKVSKKKKRKSFMLHEDEDNSQECNSSSIATSRQKSPEQKLKRKRLSRSHSPKARKIIYHSEGESLQKVRDSNMLTQNGSIGTKEPSLNMQVEKMDVSIDQKCEVILIPSSPANIVFSQKDICAHEVQNKKNGYAISASTETIQVTDDRNIDAINNDQSVTHNASDTGILRGAESIQSNISTLDPEAIDLNSQRDSQTSCLGQGKILTEVNSHFHVGESGKKMLDDSLFTQKATRLDKKHGSQISKTGNERDSVDMVPETELIDSSGITQTHADIDIHEAQGSTKVNELVVSTDEEKNNYNNTNIEKMANKNQFNTSIPKHTVLKRSALSQGRSEKKKVTDVEKTVQAGIERQRSFSGMLVSPEENVLSSGCKGSPEDIFNIDSEMPCVDNSPFDETMKQTYLSEEETVRDTGIEAQENYTPKSGNDKLSKLPSDEIYGSAESQQRKNIINHEFSESLNDKNEKKIVTNKMPISDSESDLSQQDRKKRRSGLKGARGFSGRKKQSDSNHGSSGIATSDTGKLVSSAKSVKQNSLIQREISKSPISRQTLDSEKVEIMQAQLSDQVPQNLCQKYQKGHRNTVDNIEQELHIQNELDDLPDLSQRTQVKTSVDEEVVIDDSINKDMHTDDRKQRTRLTGTSNKVKKCSKSKESPIQHHVQKDINKAHTNKDCFYNQKRIGEHNDTSSSEFDLSSSPEHSISQSKNDNFDNEEIDNCIKLARNEMINLENTFSEIRKNSEDSDSYEICQQDECRNGLNNSNLLKTDIAYKTIKRSRKENASKTKNMVPDSETVTKAAKDEVSFHTTSPHPEAYTEDPVEIVESDVHTSGSDSDDEVVTRKKSKRAVIADSSSEDEDDSSHHMNMTSSSAFSSQSENLTTQDRHALEKDLERMEKEMEALKAQLKKGQGQSRETEKSATAASSTPKSNKAQHVMTVDSDTDVDELIEMDDSDREKSDNDLFMSPPPLPLLSQDHVAETASKQSTQPDEKEEKIDTVRENLPNKKRRTALSDLDVNKPPSPGRRVHKAFVATGLTLHQVQEVKKLASLNDSKFYNKFNESVTHVVVKPASESEFLCDRTLKLFWGIANKCWIVNYYWIVDSRHAGHLLPESPYEIQGDTANGEQHQGPMKSRLSSTTLFNNFRFMCVGDCLSLSVDDMVSLIQTCGGEVVPRVELLKEGQKTPLIITCSDVEDDDGDVQLSSQDVAEFNKLYKRHQVVTVTREWVLDSLTLYQLQPLKEYVITTVKNMVVPKLPACQQT